MKKEDNKMSVSSFFMLLLILVSTVGAWVSSWKIGVGVLCLWLFFLSLAAAVQEKDKEGEIK